MDLNTRTGCSPKTAFTAPGKPCLLTPLVEIDGTPLTDYKHVIMLMRLPQ